ncbi:hypothetical protein GCM10020000_19060 [Streptomyces olivoverticillatus]
MPSRRSREDDDGGGGQGDQQRDLGAVHDAGEQVAAGDGFHAEPVVGGDAAERADGLAAEVGVYGGLVELLGRPAAERAQQRGPGRHEQEEGDDGEGDLHGGAAAQFRAGELPGAAARGDGRRGGGEGGHGGPALSPGSSRGP